MAELLLIHGGVHTKSCWERIIPRLNARDDRAVAIDLPGRGTTADRLGTVTLDDWVTAIGDAVAGFASAPVLVGHSMGGVSTSQYAERYPTSIAGVVYVCAVVPVEGTSGNGMLAEAGPDSVLLGEGVWRISQDRTSATIDPGIAAQAFYGRCPTEVVEDAIAHLVPEPVAPLSTPLRLGENFSSIRKAYIGALHDRAVPLAFQQRMAGRVGAPFHALEADHSPFFSAIEDLVAELHGAAARLCATSD